LLGNNNYILKEKRNRKRRRINTINTITVITRVIQRKGVIKGNMIRAILSLVLQATQTLKVILLA